MSTHIIAEFESVELAEATAGRLRSSIVGLGPITITSRRINKDIDTPFMLPYAPVNGRDPWIMLPEHYGYATPTGYLERDSEVSCCIDVETADRANDVRAILNNAGAANIYQNL